MRLTLLYALYMSEFTETPQRKVALIREPHIFRGELRETEPLRREVRGNLSHQTTEAEGVREGERAGAF
jgi:hypothetical protein